MEEVKNPTPPLSWWSAGILLGLVQVLAIALVEPMGVSKQFIIADSKVLNHIAPEYSENHPVIRDEEYQKFGYGWWFNIGIVIGACLAAVHLRVWKVRTVSSWWRRNHDAPVLLRLIAGFCGGMLLLIGAGLAHGCITGQFIGGWAQLSLSAVPFTVAVFGFGMLIAHLIYPKTPNEYRRKQ